eukprot:CAMPEP_0119335224 /NCGR_PEP_ID=MMETSP1333-20130426/89059_1 /TAXON_ID=418940 /ORGANISM="Scyphosphaera apsteinii, Strain RCC1455" /LENGTH=525 /DNA_ID=CAMNT_0007345727 /DNA_START=183 /DNA_END=1760 /DNA_ORIENTATION=+
MGDVVSPASRSEDKVPYMQIFVKASGLHIPAEAALYVICFASTNGDATKLQELGRTETSHKRDPLFSGPLELWDEASGKGDPVLLTFQVQSVGNTEESAKTIATTSIASDELRRRGLGMTKEGAVTALPLCLHDGRPLLGANLHCYVHAGYHRGLHRISIEGNTDQSGISTLRLVPAWTFECECLPSAQAGLILLHTRGINQSSRPLEVHAADVLVSPSTGWQLMPSPADPLLYGTAIPPGGSFYAAFVLRHATSIAMPDSIPGSDATIGAAVSNVAGMSPAELRVAFSLSEDPADNAYCIDGTWRNNDESRGAHEPLLDSASVVDVTASGNDRHGGLKPKGTMARIEGAGLVPVSPLLMEAALPLALARAGADLVQYEHLSLVSPGWHYPIVMRLRSVVPTTPCVGELTLLEIDLRLTRQVVEHRLDMRAAGVHLEMQVAPMGDWAFLGVHRQRLLVPTASDNPLVLRWQVVPLRSGHLPIPSINLWRVRVAPDGAFERGEVCPAPATLQGDRTTVLVFHEHTQ